MSDTVSMEHKTTTKGTGNMGNTCTYTHQLNDGSYQTQTAEPSRDYLRQQARDQMRKEHEGGCHTHLGSGPHPDCLLCTRREPDPNNIDGPWMSALDRALLEVA